MKTLSSLTRPGRTDMDSDDDDHLPGTLPEERPMPPFLERTDLQTWSQPYACQNARFYAFVVPADPRKLQAICDANLNEPTGGAVNYTAPIPAVLIYFA